MPKPYTGLDNCTACSTCLIYCPVAAVTPNFHGPKINGPVGERFRLSKEGETEYNSLQYCSNCKNCDISCPSGVSISALIMAAKARHCESKSHKPQLKDWLLSHVEKLGEAASLFPKVANFGQSFSLGKLFLKKIGLASNATLPLYASKTFSEIFKSVRQEPKIKKIVFYPGCFINFNQPEIGLDLITLMQKNGYEVILAAETVCCGLPLIAGGYLGEAKSNALKNLKTLSEFEKKGYPVISACTSCSLMLTDEVRQLFDLDGLDGWEKVAANIYDIFEFLLILYNRGQLDTGFKNLSGSYLYHAPCHLRAKGIGKPVLDVLSIADKLQVIDLDAGCCGISGSYGFKEDKYGIAMAVGKNLFEAVNSHGNKTVLSECASCRLQISRATNTPAKHPLSVLALGYL